MASKRVTRKPQRPLLEDACASCDRPLWVKFSHWTVVGGRVALVECGNYCSDECEDYAHNEPDEVAARLRARQLRKIQTTP